MFIIAVNLTLIALIALPIGAIILGVTIYFFLKSRAEMRETLEATRGRIPLNPKKEEPVHKKRSEIVTRDVQPSSRYEPAPVERFEKTYQKKPARQEGNIVQELKDTIEHQQKTLKDYLKHVEEIGNEGRDELTRQNNELQNEIELLKEELKSRDEEIGGLKQQAQMAENMAERIEEVYREFEQLQSKMITLEKQASHANNMAMEMEDIKQSYEQLLREVTRKQEKLEEAIFENQRLRKDLETAEDKLEEANMQRQQLQKRVQFLQDMNSDMQSMSETNKKLQTELRRLGELESMLNMISEERDHLLKKQRPLSP